MALLLSLAEVIVPMYLVIAVGFAYGRRFRPDLSAINHMTPNLLFPALFIDRLPGYEYAFGETAALLAAAALVVLVSGALALPVIRAAGHDLRAVLATAMFGNAGNTGLPVALLAFGEAGLKPALLLLVVQTVMNVVAGELLFSGRMHWRPLVRSPLLLSMAAGLGLGAWQLQLPGVLATPIGMLADIAIPLVLFAMGARFASVHPDHLGVGIGYGLLRPAAGLAAYLLVRPWFELAPLHAHMLLVFAVLPPAVFNFLLAERYGYQSSLVASITLIGNLLGFVTLALAVTWVR